jgi:Zinc finger C-x8-C-x5-C-x3-H type (and similar)
MSRKRRATAEAGCVRRRAEACEGHHPLDGDIVPLNNHGLPLRRREIVCDFFVRKGSCRFGVRCHKHHPFLLPGPPLDTKPIPAPVPGGPGGAGPHQQHHGPSSAPHWQQQMKDRLSAKDKAMNRLRRTDGAEFVVLNETESFFPQFPQHPGADACPHFMRTGDCKRAAAADCVVCRVPSRSWQILRRMYVSISGCNKSHKAGQSASLLYIALVR